MIKVDFRRFPVYTSIRKSEKKEADISEGLANTIYMNMGGVAAKSLAMRIFEDGELELNEREVGIIIKMAEGCVGMIADSLLDYFKNEGNDKG